MINTTEEVDYNLPSLSKSRWSFSLIILLVASFLMYFPVASKVESTVRGALSSIPGCPLSYESINFSFFLPKLVVKDLQAPASCFNQRGEPLTLKETNLYIRGLSFSPFGPHFKLATELFGAPFEAFITVGMDKIAINSQNSTIDLQKISTLLPAGFKLAGKAKLNLAATAGSIGVESLDVKLTSKDLTIPAQNVQAFAFSRMEVNNLLFKANMGIDGMVKVSDFILGDADSPVRAKFSGTVKLSKQAPELSRLDLRGEVAFSESFLDQYAIVGMLMNQFDKKDDFYQIQLQGTLSNPVPSSPRK